MAFHENWYRFEISVKRIFILMILSNSLECKLAAFDKFNLSLPSFMTVRHICIFCILFVYNITNVKNFLKILLKILQVMNQAYSIALLFLKVK